MAGDSQVNGNYGTQQPYGHADNHTATQADNHAGPTGNNHVESASSMPASGAPPVDTEEKTPSKEEIGWYFVEQYYKTLCNEPGKLYLYYNKRSQFVSGDEAEKVLVAVGQKAISERIKELDIQDCKVRVLNVDSQEAQRNILVQVIGEISNKAEPHRKFVQTFVLAEQPSGYYVLNDIFRYIAWEEDEYENGPEPNEANQSPVAPKPETTTLTSSSDPVQQETDAELLDRKLEEEVVEKPSTQEEIPRNIETNGQDVSETPTVPADEAPAMAPKEAEVEDPSHVGAAAEEVVEEPEKPRDPEPTPTASPPQSAKAAGATTAQTPPAPAKPAAPKTWASLVGRAAAPASVNGAAAANTSKQIQPKPKSASSTPKPSATTPDATAESSSAQAPINGNSEWQLADSKQRQNRPHSQSVSGSQTNVLGYVKNVTDKVDASLLKAQLQAFGELNYFDVSRLKNCAFIEYADSAAYNAAVAANPHNIGGEQIFVEERRPRANAYGGNMAQRGGMRGGRGGNENFRNNQGRGGFNKDGGRGGFNNRGGRGGAMPPKARNGQAQAV